MPRSLSVCWVASFLCAAVLEGELPAEEFLLVNGGRLRGEVLNPDQQPRTDYVVRLPSGVRVRFSSQQVQSVAARNPAERAYEELLPRMPNTWEGHWKMAEWCRENKLAEQRDRHLNEVLKREPNHQEARYALGYRKLDDRWIMADEYMKRQGYVRFQGAWRLRQEVELETRDRDRDLAFKEWRRQLRIWRGWIVKGRGKQQEALDRFGEIKDPAAAPALAEMLAEEEHEELRLLFIDALARLQSPTSAASFIQLALEDASAAVRDKCLDELARFAVPQAVQAFSKALKHKDNRIVNRAAVGLEIMKDHAATLPLIDALITKHKYQITTGGGLSTTFGQQGGGGLSVGGGPKIVEQERKNASVLAALVALNPGVNFVYDAAAWKAWYSSRQVPAQVNLRRDE